MGSMIDSVLGNRANGVVEQLGRQFGLDPSMASSALTALLPALAAGLKSSASSSTGVESLTGALGRGGHARYVDDLNTLGQADTVQDGNGILGHIFGSKDGRPHCQATGTPSCPGRPTSHATIPGRSALS